MRQEITSGDFASTKHISAAKLSLVAGMSVLFWGAMIVAAMAIL